MSLPGMEDRPVSVSVAGRTDPGRRRSENQDTFLVADLGNGVDGEPLMMGPGSENLREGRVDGLSLGPRGLLLLVADGMGGAAAGGVASALGARTLHRTLTATWGSDRDLTPTRFATRLVESVEAANAIVHERAVDQPELSGMGSTATAVGVLDGYLYIAQVGDSRAYLFRNGAVHQLTQDQSVVQTLVDAGRLTPEEAETSGQRHMILQALGTQEDVEVDLTYQDLRRDDVVLVCSDGLSGVVRADAIAEVLGARPDPSDVCEHLVRLANEGGGPDNVTAVVARFGGAGLPVPGEADEIGRRIFELPGT